MGHPPTLPSSRLPANWSPPLRGISPQVRRAHRGRRSTAAGQEESCGGGAARHPGVSYQPLQFEGRSGRDEERRVRVRFSVPFRCHSRQMLCVGGSQYPFGWSFVSIAKAPMTWNPTDIWTVEVDLPVGMRVEYKYVILEEQVWTKQEDEDSEGVVEVTYRSSSEPYQPPDVRTIRKQMAIVDWQPGPNRLLDVPTKEELSRLKPGEVVKRLPASFRKHLPYQKLKELSRNGAGPFMGIWEELFMEEDGTPVLLRRDEWPHKDSGLDRDAARRLFLGE